MFYHSYFSDQTEDMIEYTLWSNLWLSKINILSMPHSPSPKAPNVGRHHALGEETLLSDREYQGEAYVCFENFENT